MHRFTRRDNRNLVKRSPNHLTGDREMDYMCASRIFETGFRVRRQAPGWSWCGSRVPANRYVQVDATPNQDGSHNGRGARVYTLPADSFALLPVAPAWIDHNGHSVILNIPQNIV
jgi:hypothetical protein